MTNRRHGTDVRNVWRVLLAVLWILSLCACGNVPAREDGPAADGGNGADHADDTDDAEAAGTPLTLADVLRLAGTQELDWSHMADLAHTTDTGSGLTVWRYGMEDPFWFEMGGPSAEEDPWYADLCFGDAEEERMDVVSLYIAAEDGVTAEQLAEAIRTFLSDGKDHDALTQAPPSIRVVGAQDTAHPLYIGCQWKSDNGEEYPEAERYQIAGGTILDPMGPQIQSMFTEAETLTAVPDALSSREPNEAEIFFHTRTEPDAVTVSAWPEDADGETGAVEVPAAFDGAWTFGLLEGRWTYQIAASWDRWESPARYEGTGYYAFIGEYRIPEVEAAPSEAG